MDVLQKQWDWMDHARGRVGCVSLRPSPALRAPDLSFWSAWEGRTLVGCVALKELDASHGEIKSMRTALAHQGKGVGTQLPQYVLEEASRCGYRRLSLETGSMAHFAPAWALYRRFGFESCGPFAQYVDDPNSVFMRCLLSRP